MFRTLFPALLSLSLTALSAQAPAAAEARSRIVETPGGPVAVLDFSPPYERGAEQLAATLKAARVVGLGEATHGTKEFTELRRILLTQLHNSGWLRAVGLEVSYGDCLALNRFVLTGAGDAQDALRAISVWPSRTQEMLDLLLELQRRNQARQPDTRVHLVCYDTQDIRGALDYLQAQSPTPPALQDAITRLRALSASPQKFQQWSPEALEDAERVAASLATAPSDQAVDAALLAQSVRAAAKVWGHANVVDQVLERERQMTAMVTALAAKHDGGVAILAHNGHVMRFSQAVAPGATYETLGLQLSQTLGPRYQPIGFLFDRGAFLAVGKTGALDRFEVGPAKAGSASQLLLAPNLEAGIIDLKQPASRRSLERAPVAYRQVEAVYDPDNPEAGYVSANLVELFDGLVIVRTSSPSAPLPGER